MATTVLGGVALGLIWIWALALTYFIFKNKFAKETLEGTFSSLGAVAVAIFLLVKLIWADAPEPLSTRIDINVFQNLTTGQLFSLYVPTVDDAMDMADKSWGISEISKLPFFTKFKDLKVEETQRDLASKGPMDINTYLLEEVEFILMNWSAHYSVPSWLNDRNMSVGIHSASGSFSSLVPDGGQTIVSCDSNTFPQNRFLALEPQSFPLPRVPKSSQKSILA